MCLIAESSRKVENVMYNLHFILPRQNYPTAAILMSVSSNPLNWSQFSFYKGIEWQEGWSIIVQSNGWEESVFWGSVCI